jgi:hypothetical protein
MKSRSRYAVALAAAVLSAAGVSATQAAWEPTRPVEIIVPAGTGGGADQMARVIQGIVTKHNLMRQSMVVINKPGGAGGEAFLDVKGSRGNPHKLVITLSNLFTTPLATGIPFNWRDLTPVAMMALDEFILWVHADRRYRLVRNRRNPAHYGRRLELQGARRRHQSQGRAADLGGAAALLDHVGPLLPDRLLDGNFAGGRDSGFVHELRNCQARIAARR